MIYNPKFTINTFPTWQGQMDKLTNSGLKKPIILAKKNKAC